MNYNAFCFGEKMFSTFFRPTNYELSQSTTKTLVKKKQAKKAFLGTFWKSSTKKAPLKIILGSVNQK